MTNEQKSLCRASTLRSVIMQSTVVVTVPFQCKTQFDLLLSCDNVLKSDWFCVLSGSGMNLWKLLAHALRARVNCQLVVSWDIN